MQLVVREACRKLVAGDAAHLVTRETGQAVRSFIARELAALPAGSVMTLDFTGVGIIDFSCADECLAKLVTRLIAGEYGEKYLRLTGLGESQRENIHVALERKRLPALLVHPDGSWDCLGTITPHLRETLRLLVAAAADQRARDGGAARSRAHRPRAPGSAACTACGWHDGASAPSATAGGNSSTRGSCTPTAARTAGARRG